MGDVTGNSEYAFDAVGREVALLNPTGHRLSYGFDPVGNRAWMAAPNGRTTYQYDPVNACQLIHNPYEERTTIQWDALGREKHKTLGNGVIVSHAYDGAGRETLLENRKTTGEGIGVYTAIYDAVGNRLTSLELDGSRVTYGYDRSYQLTSEARSGTWPYDRGYLYDGVGNRLLKTDGAQRTTYAYNAAQELTRTDLPDGSITTATWDANGNLATETTGAAITSYTWDAENQSRQIIAPPNVISSYRYRADHHRSYQENDTGTRHLLWDGVNCLLELDSGLLLLADYTGLPGEWGGLASLRRGAGSGFYGFDLQWTTRQLLSAGGGVTDAYWQDAFGAEVFASGATVNPYRYVGAFGYRREDAARDDVWHRLLRRDLGRWVTRDPVGGQATGSYGYALSQPLTYLDPKGLTPLHVAALAACGVACGCVAGMVAACVHDSFRVPWGHRTEQFMQCMGDTWNGLPGWGKGLVGLCYGGCMACLLVALSQVLGRPKPPPPEPEPPPPPPGPEPCPVGCTEEEKAALHAAYHAACDLSRTCPAGMRDCAEIKRRIYINFACVVGRGTYWVKCDLMAHPTHERELREAIKVAKGCIDRSRKAGCH